MRISVHRRDNLLLLGELEISDAHHDRLLKPPPLEDHFKAIVSFEGGKPTAKIVNALQREAHVVEIDTEAGKLRLFPVKWNGNHCFATDTPDVVIANAI